MPENEIEVLGGPPPRLLDRLRLAIRARHLSERTEETYVYWTRKFILFHGRRHPDRMGPSEIKLFLTYLALNRKVGASTQNQALGALLFLYRRVLGRDLDAPLDLIRAKRPHRLPVVLSPREIAAILRHLDGPAYLAVALMYASGLRVLECLRLRVQDIDFEGGEIVVRQGKGQKDRRTLLAKELIPALREHLARLERQHTEDLCLGLGRVHLPEAVSRRYPNAGIEWRWQWIFPGVHPHAPNGGPRGRRHLHKSGIQRAFNRALKQAGVVKDASCHSLRHSFATHLADGGCDIRTIQELLGHKDVGTTMIYTRRRSHGERLPSPLDGISVASLNFRLRPHFR
jgi:integron integrase